MLEDDAYFIILVCNYEKIKIILFYQFYPILKKNNINSNRLIACRYIGSRIGFNEMACMKGSFNLKIKVILE